MATKLDRREFIKGAAAAGAFSIMAPSAALGSAANERIKAGIVGLGGRGRMIADMLQEHGGYEVRAVADYFPELAGEAGEKYGVAKKRRFSGLMGCRSLLDTDVEAVFLETPPYCFPDHVEAAVASGRHVYMAKPIACDAPGALRVQAAAAKAQAAGNVFLVDFQTRTDPLIIEGVGRVHAGEIGPACLLSSIYTDEGFADPALTDTIESRLQQLIWVNDTALGGGYFVNAGIHAIDVALWLAGDKPLSATGASSVARADPHGDAHDVYSLTYEFPGGLLLNHRGEHLGNRSGFRCDCTAYCRAGFLDTAYDGTVKMLGNSAGWRGGEVKGLYPEGARRNIAAFHECMLKGDCANLTVEPGVNATLATILGREAGERRERVTWDQMISEGRQVEPDLSGLKA